MARGYQIYCGFDADQPGETASRQMITRHPTIQRLRPPSHDWNDVLTAPCKYPTVTRSSRPCLPATHPSPSAITPSCAPPGYLERSTAGSIYESGVAKVRGVYMGCQKATTKAKPARAKQLRANGLKVDEVATAMGISRRTALRCLHDKR